MKTTTLNIITLNTNELTNALSIATSYMSKDGDFLGKITISGESGFVNVKATNNVETVHLKNISFTCSDITKDDFTPFSVDGKKMFTVLKSSKADDVSIELHESHINIKSGRSKVKIETLAEVQLISDNIYAKKLEIGSDLLVNFDKILHAIDVNNPKYELNGALLQISDGVVNLVSTDTKRLAVVTASSSIEDLEMIIPRSGIQSIIKLFDKEGVTALYDDSNIAIHTDYLSYSTKLINGKFPDFKRIIPTEINQQIIIGSEKLAGLVKEASIFDDSIVIRISGGGIMLSDYEGTTTVKDDILSDATVAFGISAKIVLDFLASSNDEEITIGFNSSNVPVVLQANAKHKEICMPIVLPDEILEDVAA